MTATRSSSGISSSSRAVSPAGEPGGGGSAAGGGHLAEPAVEAEHIAAHGLGRHTGIAGGDLQPAQRIDAAAQLARQIALRVDRRHGARDEQGQGTAGGRQPGRGELHAADRARDPRIEGADAAAGPAGQALHAGEGLARLVDASAEIPRVDTDADLEGTDRRHQATP
jgi:hypothetical protein